MVQQDSIFTDNYIIEVEGLRSQRFLSRIIDWIIEIVVVVCSIWAFLKVEQAGFKSVNYNIVLAFSLLIMFTYRFCCIFLFGNTVGMIICKLKYLKENLRPLTKTEKIVAVFGIGVSKIKLYKIKAI